MPTAAGWFSRSRRAVPDGYFGTSPAGVRRAMGLGAAHRDSIAAAGRSLTAAREAADKARKVLQSGVDPIDAKALERERARKALEEIGIRWVAAGFHKTT
jgi:hypothetical protein